MSAHAIAVDVLLAAVVLSCWLGAVGMWRMREPTQALHYLALPATIGIAALTLAVFVADGWNQVFWKMLAIAGTIAAINSVVAHATARAFRVRKLGHWEARRGDPMEFVEDSSRGGRGR